MFEKMTEFLPKLKNSQYGEWIFDKENEGTLEQSLRAPFIEYDRVVEEFLAAVYAFIEAHKEMELYK